MHNRHQRATGAAPDALLTADSFDHCNDLEELVGREDSYVHCTSAANPASAGATAGCGPITSRGAALATGAEEQDGRVLDAALASRLAAAHTTAAAAAVAPALAAALSPRAWRQQQQEQQQREQQRQQQREQQRQQQQEQQQREQQREQQQHGDEPQVNGCGGASADDDLMDGEDGGGSCNDSDTFSDVGDPGATEVLFVKEGVAVWPSRRHHIEGRLSLVKQHCVVFLAWLPYSAAAPDAGAAPPRAPSAPAATAPPLSADGSVAAVGCDEAAQDGVCRLPSADMRRMPSLFPLLHPAPPLAVAAAAAGAGGGAAPPLQASAAAAATAAARWQAAHAPEAELPLSEDGRQRCQQQEPVALATSLASSGCPMAARPPPQAQPPRPPPRPGQERGMYAIHPIPLSDIKAIMRHTPALGWQYVVVVLVSGLTLPPLVFHRGGVRQLIKVLKQHAYLVRSSSDPSTYLVNDIADPLQRSLTSLELSDFLLGAPVPGASSTPLPERLYSGSSAGGAGGGRSVMAAPPGDAAPPCPREGFGAAAPAAAPGGGSTLPGGNAGGGGGGGAASFLWGEPPFVAFGDGGGGEPFAPPWLALGETLSRVTAFARERAGSLMHAVAETLREEPFAVPAEPAAGSRWEAGAEGAAAAAHERADGVEGGDGPAVAAQAAAQADECGGGGSAAAEAVHGPGARLAAADNGGGGVAPAGSCTAETLLGSFELVDAAAEDRLELARRRTRPPRLSREEFSTYLAPDGSLADEAGFRERVFYSGVEPELRREMWKWLLGVYPPGSSSRQVRRLEAEQTRRYAQLKQQWGSIREPQARRFAAFRENKSRIDKDVRRTDRSHPFYSGREGAGNLRMLRDILLTYSMYNFDLSYCQGMSDLASPVLYVMRDEVEAFWAFAALMEVAEPNFSSDQRGMHAQLLALRRLVALLDPQLAAFFAARDADNYFFCFRWLLIYFKREFIFDEVLRLWEALWSRHLTPHLHLYLAAAVLIHHRRTLMDDPSVDFDGLLRFCVQLGGKIDLDAMLRLAEALVLYAGAAGKEACEGLPT